MGVLKISPRGFRHTVDDSGNAGGGKLSRRAEETASASRDHGTLPPGSPHIWMFAATLMRTAARRSIGVVFAAGQSSQTPGEHPKRTIVGKPAVVALESRVFRKQVMEMFLPVRGADRQSCRGAMRQITLHLSQAIPPRRKCLAKLGRSARNRFKDHRASGNRRSRKASQSSGQRQPEHPSSPVQRSATIQPIGITTA